MMLFGVINVTAAFQQLKLRVLANLQSESATEFVSVYLDDVIGFSEILDDHIVHLKAVFDRLTEKSWTNAQSKQVQDFTR